MSEWVSGCVFCEHNYLHHHPHHHHRWVIMHNGTVCQPDRQSNSAIISCVVLKHLEWQRTMHNVNLMLMMYCCHPIKPGVIPSGFRCKTRAFCLLKLKVINRRIFLNASMKALTLSLSIYLSGSVWADKSPVNWWWTTTTSTTNSWNIPQGI